MRVILISVQVWRYASERVNVKYRPCSKRQEDLEKKTTCYVFRCPRQALLVADNLEVNERTQGKTRRQHTLGMQSSPLMNQKECLNKDSHQLVVRSKMKAQTPLVSQQREDTIRSPNYQMQCTQC